MSKIEQLIDEIEEYVEGCKPAPFSQSKIIVQKEQLYELLTELRLKTPDEIKRYQKIIAQKDKIISDAQAQAEKMIEETTAYAQALVEEHEIMLKAYEKAEQTINAANAEAEEILSSANQNAEEVRVSALDYSKNLISNIQTMVEHSIDIARQNSDGLINGLSENLNVLISNNDALSSQINNQPVVEQPTAAQQAAEEWNEDEDEEVEQIPEVTEEVIEEPELKPTVKEEEEEYEDFDEEYEDDDYDDID